MIIAIIPARGGSKAIPKKNIVDFCGKPLIAWTIGQAKASKLISEVYVSTDSDEIADISKRYGATVIKRPYNISTDTSTSEEALKYTLKEIDKEINYVVFLQATSPLRAKDDIDNAIKKIKKENADSLLSGTETKGFFIWIKKNNKMESYNYDYKERKMRQEAKKQFLENGSIYIFKPEILWKHNNRLGGKITTYEMDLWRSFEIDDKKDLEQLKVLFECKTK